MADHNSILDSGSEIKIDALFKLEELQRLQDLFADSHGVASVITQPDGTPITEPSNFTNLCFNIIRKTEKGCANCYKSDAIIGGFNSDGPTVQPCLSGGLWDAGASISVGGKHIGSWLIGQVRNEETDEKQMLEYAHEIGADQNEFVKALHEVPQMHLEKFKKIANLLFAFANELSEKAYNNLQLKIQIEEREKTVKELEVSREELITTLYSIGDGVITTDIKGLVVSMNPVAEKLCGWKLKNAIDRPLGDIFKIINSETREIVSNPVQKVIETGQIIGLANHTVLISNDGIEYQIADSAAPIINKLGEIKGVVLVFSDVTEKYNKEEEIRISEKKFHSLFENMIEGAALHELIFDNQGIAVDYRIIDTNPAFGKHLGIDRKTIIGKPSCEAYGVTEPPYFEIYTKVAKTGEPRFFETFFPPLDKHFSISVYQTNENGFATVFEDISERKRASELLRESEERWRRAVADAPVPIMIHDEDDQVLQLSAGWTLFSKYTIEDIPTLADWTEKAYGERTGLKKEYIDQLFSINETVKNGEWTITTKDGEKRIWDFQSTPLGNLHKGRRVLQSMAIDITEQKQAEQKLLESEERLQYVLKGSQLGYWDWNLETNEVNRNERWAEMLGYKLDDVAFTVNQWIDFIHPDDQEMAAKSIQDHLEGKTDMHRLEYRMRTKDGNYKWILDQAQAVKWNTERKVIRMSGTHTDVTDRKLVEETIKLEQQFSKSLIDSLPGIFYLYSYPEMRLVRWNKNYETIFGYSTQEVQELEIDKFKRPEVKQRLNEAFEEVLEKGQIMLEVTLYTKEGLPIHFHLTGLTIELQERKYIVGVGYDISDRKRTEVEILNKNNQLILANAEKDKFFSIIAHDLKSPFNSFLGFTELMVDELENMSLKQLQEMADNMKKSAYNLYNLLENLLEWSRIQRGMGAFDPKTYNLVQKINQSTQAVFELAKKKGIEIRIESPEDLTVFVDENMLESTIRNLLSNAVKFSKSGGEIVISAKEVNENFVEISVADSGIGMNQSLLNNLFRIDVQTSRPGTEGESSTGLGLLLCKEFIEKHGGEIWAESEEGKGSTFYFTIPTHKS